MLKVVDIRAVADLAHSAGARVACDSTWATPVLQRPLEWGADCVVHSTTKYLGGHSDVSGGRCDYLLRGRFFPKNPLPSIDGRSCTLALRLLAGSSGDQDVAVSCANPVRTSPQSCGVPDNSPMVAAVHYPGLSVHPGHAVAARQMKAYGGMLSFQVRGGSEKAMSVAAKVKLFTRATSLGGLESLIEHRASIEGEGTRTPLDLLRVSIGLEHVEDLIEDLDQALG